MTFQSTASGERLIRISEVSNLTGISDAQVYDLIRANEFPKQIKLGRASRWSFNEVLHWVEMQKTARTEQIQ